MEVVLEMSSASTQDMELDNELKKQVHSTTLNQKTQIHQNKKEPEATNSQQNES